MKRGRIGPANIILAIGYTCEVCGDHDYERATLFKEFAAAPMQIDTAIGEDAPQLE